MRAQLNAIWALAGLLAMVVAFSPNVAGSAKEATDFLFAEDNQIALTPEELPSRIEPKLLIRNNEWLNGPLTRLDYVLIKIQSHLTASESRHAQDLIAEYFEESAGYVSAYFNAGFSETTGRLVIGANVNGGGKPKKPMKEFCERVLGGIELQYPLRPSGYAWHNNALGLLQREPEAAKYGEIVSKLVASALINVSVSTGYSANGVNTVFILGCMRQASNSPIIFYKYARPLSTRR